MAYDPWDWANQNAQPAPLSTIRAIKPMATANEQGAPGQTIAPQPNQDLQQIRGMAINKGAEKGAEYISKEYDAYKASQLADPTYTMAPGPPLGSQAASTSMTMPAGLDMSGATTAGYPATAPLTASAAVPVASSVAPLSAAAMPGVVSSVPAAGMMGSAVAPVAAEAALATTAATAAPLATAGAATSAAPVLAGMGPVGWGIGAALLLNSMFG